MWPHKFVMDDTKTQATPQLRNSGELTSYTFLENASRTTYI